MDNIIDFIYLLYRFCGSNIIKVYEIKRRQEKSSIQKSLGEVLKQYRVDCKMTQEFVAEAIGVSRQAVSKWETGAADPSFSNLVALAKLFNISAEELIKEVQ